MLPEGFRTSPSDAQRQPGHNPNAQLPRDVDPSTKQGEEELASYEAVICRVTPDMLSLPPRIRAILNEPPRN